MPDDRQGPLLAVVDHDVQHRSQIAGALRAFYRIAEYGDGQAALRGVSREPVDLLVIDDQAAPNGGYEFAYLLRASKICPEVPVVITSRLEAGPLEQMIRHCGANAGLTRPYRRSALLKTVSTLLNQQVEARWEVLPAIQRAALRGTLDVFNAISEIMETGTRVDFAVVREACAPLIEVIARSDFRGLLAGVKSHDNYTYAHSVKVATMLCLFGHTMGLSEREQLALACGGLLHDTGKMMIPNAVLNKPGRLEPDEWNMMRAHVPVTLEFLQAGIDIPRGAVVIAAQHHERLDGSGYPLGLKGSELNELARMAAIVDVFSALTDHRVYRPAMTPEAALAVMTDSMATHLDQHFLRLFKHLMLDVGQEPT